MNVKLVILTAIIAMLLSVFNPIVSPVKEGWWGGTQFSNWATPETMNMQTGKVSAMQSNMVRAQIANNFVSVPSFQSMLSPRMGIAQGIGTYIRYNPGSYETSAIPSDPLTGNGRNCNYGEMFEESYVPEGCNQAGAQSSQAPGNWNNKPMSVGAVQSAVASAHAEGVSTLPVGTMDTMNTDGQEGQEVMMARYMVSLPKSRLYGLADYIRGDLAIVPNATKCGEDWFQVHPRVNIDLNGGAMNAMGGVDNGSARALAGLINAASGSAKTTIGGVNLANVDMTPQFKTSFSEGIRTVNVTGFP